ncbi:hypothetical protein [Lacipirellula sp.]|uniref:hypothetical protein n=1 Tax=Lacipirellula sp. TaxID=2691419 RepID=UPI003D0B7D50
MPSSAIGREIAHAGCIYPQRPRGEREQTPENCRDIAISPVERANSFFDNARCALPQVTRGSSPFKAESQHCWRELRIVRPYLGG